MLPGVFLTIRERGIFPNECMDWLLLWMGNEKEGGFLRDRCDSPVDTRRAIANDQAQ